jgi:hypothetical protein
LSVLQSLQDISLGEIGELLKELAAMPEPEYHDACRQACSAAVALQRPTWMIFTNAHINALLFGFRKIKFTESYAITKLMATIECYCFGVLGQTGLALDNYNLAIGPVAHVFSPEMFLEEQTWEIQPLPKFEYVRPPYRTIRKSKNKPGNSELDLISLVDSLVKEANTSLNPSSPTQTFHTVPTESSDALDAMLDSISTAK